MDPMQRPRRKTTFLGADDGIFTVKHRKVLPYEFVLDALAPLSIETRSMFGCLAVYVGDKIVLILRDKHDASADNGVWLATTEEHHESLRREFPNMRSIEVFRKHVTGWQVLPVAAPDFEEAALRQGALLVVHAWTRPQVGMEKPYWALSDPSAHAMEGKVAQRLTALIEDWRAKYPDVPVSQDVGWGHPGRALADLSAQADLVVIGRRPGAHGPGMAQSALVTLD